MNRKEPIRSITKIPIIASLSVLWVVMIGIFSLTETEQDMPRPPERRVVSVPHPRNQPPIKTAESEKTVDSRPPPVLSSPELRYNVGVPWTPGVYACRVVNVTGETMSNGEKIVCHDLFLLFHENDFYYLGGGRFRGEIIGWIGPLPRVHKSAKKGEK